MLKRVYANLIDLWILQIFEIRAVYKFLSRCNHCDLAQNSFIQVRRRSLNEAMSFLCPYSNGLSKIFTWLFFVESSNATSISL